MIRARFPLTLVVLGVLFAGCASAPPAADSASTITPNTSDPSDKPVNTMCPVMNYPVNANYSVIHRKMKIGLCCEACVVKWSSLTDDERDLLLLRVGVRE